MRDIEKFIEAIKADDFVKGHEVLEHEWKRLKQDSATLEESKLLKGLINGSTAIALKLRGKESAAKRVWDTFEKYRSLISTTTFKDSNLYKEAEKILDEKYRIYM